MKDLEVWILLIWLLRHSHKSKANSMQQERATRDGQSHFMLGIRHSNELMKRAIPVDCMVGGGNLTKIYLKWIMKDRSIGWILLRGKE